MNEPVKPDPKPVDVSAAPFVAVAVGNTRARLGVFRGRELAGSVSVALDAPDTLAGRVAGLAETAGSKPGAILVASVNDPGSASLESALAKIWPGVERFRIGEDLPIPMAVSLDDTETVGVDRLLGALAAYDRAKQACIVVDAGTAVTVDFVDGEGTFQGGGIAPGLSLMLKALHEHTAALPDIPFETPDASRGPFGKDTPHAMRVGVAGAVRGMVRELAERYAEYYDAYPQIIATGGDMGLLEGDGLVEHFVADLQLMGIQVCAERALAGEG